MARKIFHVAHPLLKAGPNNLFLRIGRNFGCSRCGLDAEWRAETGKISEAGTSVYFVHPHKDSYMIRYPDQSCACYGIGGDYFGHMFTDVLLRPICAEEIYLVRGKLIPIRDRSDEACDFAMIEIEDKLYEQGISSRDVDIRAWGFDTGSDGEPLLQAGSARIVKQLTLPEFLGLYLNDNFRVGDLRRYGETFAQLCAEELEEICATLSS